METLVLIGLIASILLLLVFLAVVLRLLEWAFPSLRRYLDERMPENEERW